MNTVIGTAALAVALLGAGGFGYGAGHVLVAVICWAAACGLIVVAVAVLISLVWERRASAAQPVAVAPAPTVGSPPPPPSPPARVIYDAPLKDIRAAFEAHTSVQAKKLVEIYEGKWFRVVGKLQDASDFSSFIQVTFGAFDHVGRGEHHVYMYFGKEWGDRLAMLKKGDPMTVIGRVDRIDAFSVHLEKCEIEQPQPAQSLG